jgi:hypothetical protein
VGRVEEEAVAQCDFLLDGLEESSMFCVGHVFREIDIPADLEGLDGI